MRELARLFKENLAVAGITGYRYFVSGSQVYCSCREVVGDEFVTFRATDCSEGFGLRSFTLKSRKFPRVEIAAIELDNYDQDGSDPLQIGHYEYRLRDEDGEWGEWVSCDYLSDCFEAASRSQSSQKESTS